MSRGEYRTLGTKEAHKVESETGSEKNGTQTCTENMAEGSEDPGMKATQEEEPSDRKRQKSEGVI